MLLARGDNTAVFVSAGGYANGLSLSARQGGGGVGGAQTCGRGTFSCSGGAGGLGACATWCTFGGRLVMKRVGSGGEM